jgi:hypothetical protein
MHLGISDDINAAMKLVYNMILNLEKEFYSLNTHKKTLEEIHDLLD